MAAQSGFADANRSSLCFSYVLGFFFNKGVRGGPRVLMNLAGVLVVLIIFVKLLPSNMTESALQVIPLPTKIWSGSSHQQYTVPAGLRIVVFGELDIGTPVGGSQETEGSRSWTEALCDQVSGGLRLDVRYHTYYILSESTADQLPYLSSRATATSPWCPRPTKPRGPSAQMRFTPKASSTC